MDSETRAAALEELLVNAARHKVTRLLAVGFDIQSSSENVAIARQHAEGEPQIWAATGIHPHNASSAERELPKELEVLLREKRVAALGEIGLDYFYDNSPREFQQRVFCAQIELAVKAGKPIITHIRDARERSEGDANAESLTLLRECHADRVGGVIHCFSGGMKDAEAALELGFYISFAGPVTYPRSEGLRRVAAAVPLDRLLCETDAPYLAPQPLRGKRNEPANVRFVYETIARERGMELEALAAAAAANCERVFGWCADV